MQQPVYDTDHPDFDLAAVFAEAGLPVSPPLEVLDQVCLLPALFPDLPAPVGIRRDNPRKQGEIGFSDAIGWFGRRGLTVSVPLVDAQAYDLIVDLDPYGLARVQVKTSTQVSPYGVPICMIETAGGNQSFHTRKAFDSSASDLLYVVAAGDRWIIPSERIMTKRTISMGSKVERFRVGAG